MGVGFPRATPRCARLVCVGTQRQKDRGGPLNNLEITNSWEQIAKEATTVALMSVMGIMNCIRKMDEDSLSAYYERCHPRARVG